ncbi:MAG TPA: 1,2-phenylacetyl-CoA epoxidase subunit PaaC [Chitinophagaceae bacterium]|nr:1,2-phenylacetyl-CoA epoxidase subunit PaaC [Chitinophagaceae bacterium]
MLREALAELITKMADDELILGHRNSAWTGLGPILEEDIAFSSMAQDKIGHALALYTLLRELSGIKDMDHFAFGRQADQFKCCHLVEYPNGEYDFSLMRHFLFDAAETLRYESLEDSSFEPLRQLSRKFRGELKYHMLHGNTWVIQLGHGDEESHARMQGALDACFPLAFGIFEQGNREAFLIDQQVYPGERVLQERWLEKIYPVLVKASLNMPAPDLNPGTPGGRQGKHTVYFAPLLEEMSEVFRMDPETAW